MDTLHNNPPSDAELFEQRIADLDARIAAFAEQDVTEANAGEFRDMIGLGAALAKEIEAKRKEVKQPILDAAKDVDSTFNPLKVRAEQIGNPLKAKLQAFLKEQQRLADEARREAQRKAEEEAAKAAAYADDPLLGDGVEDAAKAAAAEARMAEAEAKAKAAIKGSAGFRAASIRTTYKGEVTDAAAMVAHYASHPDVIEAALKAANAEIRSSKGSAKIPGVAVVAVESLV